jgi:hypothetical protein
MAKVICEGLIVNTGYRCNSQYSMKLVVDAEIPYDIVCCKKHVRSLCYSIVNKRQNFKLYQKVSYRGGVDMFESYPLSQIKSLLLYVAPHIPPNEYIHPWNQVVPLIPRAPPVVVVPVVVVPVVVVPVVVVPVVLRLTPVLEEGQLHPCCICFEDTDAVLCSNNRHAMCFDCFNGHVVAESHRPEFDTTVKCPLNRMKECDCHGFSVSFIAKHCDDETFDQFDRKRYEIKEKTTMLKFQEDFEIKLKLEQTLSNTQKDRLYVIENIFTLKCPWCSSAYADFDGCMALKCSCCLQYFCGKCHLKCASLEIAHNHSHTCTHGGAPIGYFHSTEVINKCQNEMRKLKLLAFLKKKGTNKKEILQLLEKDMNDIHLII